MTVKYLLLLAGAVAGIGISTNAHANLVANGDFSSPAQAINSSGYTSFDDNSASGSIPNFTITGPVQILNSSIGTFYTGFPDTPVAGQQTLQLFNDSGGGGVTTSITIPTGETDTISFYVGGRDGPSSADVTFGGIDEGIFSSDSNITSNGGAGYVLGSFNVLGTGLPLDLAFTDKSGKPVLQDVGVAPAPEPTSFALLGLASVGLLSRRHRRA